MKDSRANSESGWDNQNVMRGQKRQRVRAEARPDDGLHASSHKIARASILFVTMDCRERRQVYVVCARQTTLPGHDERKKAPAKPGPSI